MMALNCLNCPKIQLISIFNQFIIIIASWEILEMLRNSKYQKKIPTTLHILDKINKNNNKILMFFKHNHQYQMNNILKYPQPHLLFNLFNSL